MAVTRIPQQFRLGFAKIKTLSSADVDTLVAALETSPRTGGLKGMISSVAAQVPSLKKGDVEDIVRTLYSLYLYRADADTLLPGFISELIGAMRATGEKSLALPEEAENEFQDKLTRLLGVTEFAVASKADQLRSDYAKTFHSAKILTDIRPIFGKPEEIPIGAAITHTLKIEYHEEGEHKQFYIAMDAEDLQQMRKVLQRADDKASSLKSLLKNAGLPDMSEGEI